MAKSSGGELIKNTIIIGSSKIIIAAISFLLLPIMTKHLSVSDYGVVDLALSYVALMTPILLLGLDVGALRFLIEARGDNVQKAKVVSSLLVLVVIALIVGTSVFILVNSIFSLNLKNYLILYFLSAVVFSLSQQMIRGDGNNFVFSVTSLTYAIVSATLIITGLMFFNFKVEGIIVSYIIAAFISSMINFATIRVWKFCSFNSIDKNLMKRMISYSLPIVPNGISGWVFRVSDRTIISIVIGSAANGIYAISNKFSNVLGVLDNVLYTSWAEAAAVHINDEDRDVFFSKVFNTELSLFGYASMIAIPSVGVIFPFFVDKAFYDAYLYFPPLVVGVVLNFVVGFYSVIYLAKMLTKQVMVTSVVGAVINVLLNITFVGIIGIWAAALSTAVTFGVLAVYRHFDLKKYINLSIDWSSVSMMIIGFFVVLVLYYMNSLIWNVVGIILSTTLAILGHRVILTDMFRKIWNKVPFKK